MEGLVDEILGHVSVRIPDTNEMLIRCRGPHECGVAYTQADAIQRVTLAGEGAEAGYHVPKELSIHSELYKARPEVTCVVHAHPLEALVCGIAELDFRPVFGSFNIPAMRLALEGIPVFEHSYLVTRPDLAKPFVEAMGDKDVCVMRGHGITVTGRSVEDAVVRALNFNTLAKVTLQVAQTGRQARVITEEDIRELPDLGHTFNQEWVWRYYEHKLKRWERA